MPQHTPRLRALRESLSELQAPPETDRLARLRQSLAEPREAETQDVEAAERILGVPTAEEFGRRQAEEEAERERRAAEPPPRRFAAGGPGVFTREEAQELPPRPGPPFKGIAEAIREPIPTTRRLATEAGRFAVGLTQFPGEVAAAVIPDLPRPGEALRQALGKPPTEQDIEVRRMPRAERLRLLAEGLAELATAPARVITAQTPEEAITAVVETAFLAAPFVPKAARAGVRVGARAARRVAEPMRERIGEIRAEQVRALAEFEATRPAGRTLTPEQSAEARSVVTSFETWPEALDWIRRQYPRIGREELAELRALVERRPEAPTEAPRAAEAPRRAEPSEELSRASAAGVAAEIRRVTGRTPEEAAVREAFQAQPQPETVRSTARFGTEFSLERVGDRYSILRRRGPEAELIARDLPKDEAEALFEEEIRKARKKPAPIARPPEAVRPAEEIVIGPEGTAPRRVVRDLSRMTDDQLRTRWAEEMANLARAQAEEFTVTKGAPPLRPMFEGGERITGAVGTGAGRFARGRQTQTRERLDAIQEEAARRGLEAPDEFQVLVEAGRPLFQRILGEPMPEDVASLTEFRASLLRGLQENPGDGYAGLMFNAADARIVQLGGRSLVDEAVATLGATDPRVLGLLGLAGVGAGVGAAVSPDDRTIGAVAGALIAALGPLAFRRLRQMGEVGAVTPPGARTPPVEPAKFVNLAKLALDPSGEARLRQEVARVVERMKLAPKEREPFSKVREMAEGLGLDPGALSRVSASRMSRAELLAVRNIVKGNVESLGSIYRRLESEPGLTAAERFRLEQVVAGLEGQNDALLSKLVKAPTETARDLNALKMLAHDNLDPVAWFARAKRKLGWSPFTEEHRTKIQGFINEGDRAGLARYVNSLRPSSFWEKATTAWKAFLLSAFRTHEINFLSNTVFAPFEAAKDIPAARFDRLLRAYTGVQTKSPSTQGLVFASVRGAGQGFREVIPIMRGQGIAEAIRKYDQHREVDFGPSLGGRLLNASTRVIFRGLVAGDRPFRLAARERALVEQARLLAKREGFQGEAFKRRVAELLENPTDEMALRAIGASEVAIFMNPGIVAEATLKAKRAVRERSEVAGAAAETIVPFAMAPSNILARVVEFSPVGLIASLAEVPRLLSLARRARRQPELLPELEALQLKIVERFGRGTIGMGFPILAGFALYRAGLMTGLAPDSPAELAQWQLEGKQPMAIRIGSRWYHIGRLAPIGPLMVVGAEFARGFEEEEARRLGPAVRRGATALTQSVFEQPFLTGLREFIRSHRDPIKGIGRFAEQYVGSWVPNFVAQTARIFDPELRVTDDAFDRILSRIPGASRLLPARRNLLGEKIRRRDPTALAAIAEAFDPFYSRRDRTLDDPLIAELERVGAVLPRPGRRKGESNREYNERLAFQGMALRGMLEQIVASPDYQRMSDVATTLVRQPGEYRGRDPEEVARELQALLILKVAQRTNSAMSQLRRALLEAEQRGLSGERQRLEAAARRIQEAAARR